MQHILSVTIQGQRGFSNGYVWWMSGEEILFWCPEHMPVGEEVRLRIDWAGGTDLLDCTATIHGVLPLSVTSVKEGRAYFATYELVKPEDEDRLFRGLFQANPDLKAKGFGHLPHKLSNARRRAEGRIGKKLGQITRRPPKKKPVRARNQGMPARRLVPRFPGDKTPAPPPAEFLSESSAGSLEFVGAPTTGAAKSRDEQQAILDEFEKDEVSESLDFTEARSRSSSGTKSSGRKGTAGSSRKLHQMAKALRKRAESKPPPPVTVKVSPVEPEQAIQNKRGYLRLSDFMAGPPSTALLRINDPAQAQRAVDFDDHQIAFFLRREPDLPLWELVSLLVVLPDATVLQFMGKVMHKTSRGMCMMVEHPTDMDLEALRDLLKV